MKQRKRRRVLAAVDTVQAHFRRILRGAAGYAHTHRLGWQIAETWGGASAGIELGHIREMDGVLLQGAMGRLREMAGKAGIPWVQVSGLEEPAPGEVTVLPDNREIGRVAAAHFVENGFREFAFRGAVGHWYSRERLAGFLEGIGEFPCVVLDDVESESAEEAGALAGLAGGTALFCANDIFARRSVRILRDAGRSVPEDVAVLGVDNDETVLALSEVPLSSIDPRSEEIGAEAARLLGLRMAGRAAPRLTLVAPGGVVVRQSSDILMIADAKVSAAVALIREEACRGLGVEEVVRRSGMSRRTLERRFTSALGRGIMAEMRRVRVRRAIELLGETDLPVSGVAEEAGFSDIYYFSSAFRKATGKSPSGWRRRKKLKR